MKTFNKKYCCGMEDKGFMAEGLRAGRGMEASAEAAFQVEALRTERLLC